jgi:hypothetical protein
MFLVEKLTVVRMSIIRLLWRMSAYFRVYTSSPLDPVQSTALCLTLRPFSISAWTMQGGGKIYLCSSFDHRCMGEKLYETECVLRCGDHYCNWQVPGLLKDFLLVNIVYTTSIIQMVLLVALLRLLYRIKYLVFKSRFCVPSPVNMEYVCTAECFRIYSC